MTTLAALAGALFLKPALIVGAAAVLARTLRHHAAAARHAVWAGAIVATLALPVLGAVLPPLRVSAVDRLLPATARSVTSPTTAPDVLAPRTASVAPLPNELSTRVATHRSVPPGWLAAASAACWLLGALLLGVRRVIAGARVRGIARRASAVADDRLRRLFTDIAESSVSTRRAELRLSGETASPAVTGMLRPVVLLPNAAIDWSSPDLTAVLAHELAHVARRDHLLNVFGDIASILYWCNPAIRLAVRRMRAESEKACDDQVLQRGAEPEGYAHLLLRVAHAARADGGLANAVTAMARPRELESRLLAVLDHRAMRTPPPHWRVVALAAAGMLVALPTATLTVRAAAAAPTSTQTSAPEPDRLADSLTSPASERIPLTGDAYRVSPSAERAQGGRDSVVVRLLVAALAREPRGESDLVRDRAAWALSQARDGVLVEPLMDALDDRDWRVQSYAAWTLALVRDPRAVPRLIPLLEHPVWRLRAMAANALRESRDVRAERAMSSALTDPAWQVRLEAVEFLAALGGAAGLELLRPRLEDRHIAVRLAAERAFTSR